MMVDDAAPISGSLNPAAAFQQATARKKVIIAGLTLLTFVTVMRPTPRKSSGTNVDSNLEIASITGIILYTALSPMKLLAA